jgi:hypothetical protein
MNNETIAENVPTFEIIIEREIAKYDLPAAAIKKLEQEFMPLSVKSLDDEEGYAQVKEALRFMVSKRNEVEDKRKELKADSLKFGRAVDDEAKRLTLMLSPIELHLKAEKDKIDSEKKRVAEEEEARKQRVIVHRHEMLVGVGMVILGDIYYFENLITNEKVQLHKLNIETMDDNDFNEFVFNVGSIKVEVDNYLREEKEKREREQQKIYEEQEVLRREQEAMRLQKEAIDREMQAMINSRNQVRKDSLLSLGIQYSEMTGFYFYNGESIITHPEVQSIDSFEWEERLNDIKLKVDNLKIQEAEQKLERERVMQEQIEKLAEEQRLAKEKAEADAIEEQNRLEAERVQGLDDVSKMAEYCDKLLSTTRPEMKTPKYKKEMKVLVDMIASHIKSNACD